MPPPRRAIAVSLVTACLTFGCATTPRPEAAAEPPVVPAALADASVLAALPADAWFFLASAPARVDARLGLGALARALLGREPGLGSALGEDLTDLGAWPRLGLDPRGVAGVALVAHPTAWPLPVFFATLADPGAARAAALAAARRLEVSASVRARGPASVVAIGPLHVVLRQATVLVVATEDEAMVDALADLDPAHALGARADLRAALAPLDAGDAVIAWLDRHAYDRLAATHGSLLGGEDELPTGAPDAPADADVAEDAAAAEGASVGAEPPAVSREDARHALAVALSVVDGGPCLEAFAATADRDIRAAGAGPAGLGSDDGLALRVELDATRARPLIAALGLDASLVPGDLDGPIEATVRAVTGGVLARLSSRSAAPLDALLSRWAALLAPP